MMKKLLALALVLGVAPGCFTVAGGVTGGVLASSHNSDNADKPPARGDQVSVGGSVVAGLAIGLVLDSLIVYSIANSTSSNTSTSTDSHFGGLGWGD